jgi:hypothetical protein
MNADQTSLREEIDQRIYEVQNAKGQCAGHDSLSRAVCTLLRCQRAQLSERGGVAWKAGGTAAALVAIIEGMKALGIGAWFMSMR